MTLVPESISTTTGFMDGDGPIRVALIEDTREVREGLAALINGTRGFTCQSSYYSMEAALAGLSRQQPDVILMDIGLPGMSGIEGIGILRDRYPQIPILALTVYDNDEKVFNALCAGASGYLLKNTPPAKLLEAISETHKGGAPMSPEIARKVVTLFQKTGPPEKLDEQLTPQEMRLLRLLVEGHTYQGAADLLKISIHTARNYIRSIYDKLHVHSKSEAVTKALRSRIIY